MVETGAVLDQFEQVTRSERRGNVPLMRQSHKQQIVDYLSAGEVPTFLNRVNAMSVSGRPLAGRSPMLLLTTQRLIAIQIVDTSPVKVPQYRFHGIGLADITETTDLVRSHTAGIFPKANDLTITVTTKSGETWLIRFLSRYQGQKNGRLTPKFIAELHHLISDATGTM